MHHANRIVTFLSETRSFLLPSFCAYRFALVPVSHFRVTWYTPLEKQYPILIVPPQHSNMNAVRSWMV